MDSGNSGSFQSSSGGDDDYDSSRGGAAPDSFSSFFNHQSNYPPAAHVTTSFNPPPPPPPPVFFDPLASYLDHLSRSTNLEPVWPKDSLLRPDQLNLPSSSSLPAGYDNPQPPTAADPQINQNPGGGGAPPRNPKKRTRASRKAPTTVLTTDTTNFRAMVQEFTGIPAPPFGAGGGNSSSSLFFPRSRLDLFGGRMDSPLPSTNISPYLLRPHAQKIPIPRPHQPPPLVSTMTATNKNDLMTASSSGGGNFEIPDLGLYTSNVPTNLSFGSSLKFPDSGPSKPGSGGSLELPITTKIRNDQVRDQLGGITASFFPTADGVNSQPGQDDGGGPLGWAEELGLGADADADADGSRHSQHRSHNLGFAHH